MTREHVIDPSAVHHRWDTGLAPLLVITLPLAVSDGGPSAVSDGDY